MTSTIDKKQKSLLNKEERLNVTSHALGFLLSIFGFYLLWVKNSNKTEFSVLSIVVYGGSLISMFAISMCYHAITNPIRKRRLRIVDHINIYFLIAGTYTPVALITLIKGNGMVIFITVWIIAALGTLFKLFYTGKLEYISLLLYIAMGWLIVFDFENLMANTSTFGVELLFLGGLCYTFGILFYVWDKISYNHFIWHLFVMAGALCHWLFIYFDVI